MPKKIDPKEIPDLANILQSVAEFLSGELPDCDVVLLARPEGEKEVFCITNNQEESVIEIIRKYLSQKKEWEIEVSTPIN